MVKALDTYTGCHSPMRVSGIYAIWNDATGRVYVGLSGDVVSRWRHHCRKLRLGTHANVHLQAAWLLNGEANFRFELLVEEPDRALLPALERQWMVRLNAFDRAHGYNLDAATEANCLMGAETKAKIGAANKGKVRTPEMRAKMRLAKLGQGKGRVKSAEEVGNLRAAHAKRAKDPDGYASFRTDEGRARLSAAGLKGANSRWRKGESDGS